MENRKLVQIEGFIFELFQSHRAMRLLAREIFDSTPEYANADLVRAFEDLEKRQRLLVRYTDSGTDWVHLTPEGAKHAGLTGAEAAEIPKAVPHPPRSST